MYVARYGNVYKKLSFHDWRLQLISRKEESIRQRYRRILAVLSILTVAGLISATSLGTASAQGTPNHRQNLIDTIATKFGLDKAEVQKVFDEERSLRRHDRSKQAKQRLDEAVKDGKLTQSQADEILNQAQKFESFLDELDETNEDKRRTLIQNKRAEIKQWANQNNIPKRFVHLIFQLPIRDGINYQVN